MSTETGSWKTLEQSYGFFAKGLEYPDPEFWGGIEGKALGELALLDDDAGFANGAADECFPPRDQQDREVEYVSTFDGRSLQQYEGSCRPRVGRDGILEEVLRFYHHFGLKLNEARRDFPDNFITELEFMGHLLRLEAQACARGGDAESYARAQRDFLARHVVLWAEALPERMERMKLDNCYCLLAKWLRVFVRAHLEKLNARVGASDPETVEGKPV